MSCPCKQTDNMRQCDYCTVTGAKVGGVLICDVDYDYCPDYLNSRLYKRKRLVESALKKEQARKGKNKKIRRN